MPTIEFGPGLINGFNERVWKGNTSTSFAVESRSLLPIVSYLYYFSGYDTASYFAIYKGSVPSTTVGFEFGTRDSDMLIRFNFWNSLTEIFNTSDFSSNPVVITTAFKAATASGTATWFRIYGSNPFIADLSRQMIGTIGSPGSGADLQMNSTSIVSGNFYRVNNLRIRLPYTFNVA